MTGGEPARRSWPILFGTLLEAVNGTDIDPTGRTDLLKLLDSAQAEGRLAVNCRWGLGAVGHEEDKSEDPPPAAGSQASSDIDSNDCRLRRVDDGQLLECDCSSLRVTRTVNTELIAVIPLHQLASVGFLREPPSNILALKVGDVLPGAPDLFDLVVLFARTEAIAEEICQHLALCFQFLYREALSTLEQFGEGEQETVAVPPKNSFVAAAGGEGSPTSFCSSNGAAIHLQRQQVHRKTNVAPNSLSEDSSTSSGRQRAVEQVNDYLTMLSACLSHDELNKFAILLRRWRAREMAILEFAQKLLELYGPERRHLLARMRSLLHGDPSEMEALGDFLQANGVVQNAASGGPSSSSSPLTAEMSLGGPADCEEPESGNRTGSCPPPSASVVHSRSSSHSQMLVFHRPNSSFR